VLETAYTAVFKLASGISTVCRLSIEAAAGILTAYVFSEDHILHHGNCRSKEAVACKSAHLLPLSLRVQHSLLDRYLCTT